MIKGHKTPHRNIKIDIDDDIGLQMKTICQQLKLKQKDVAKAIDQPASLMSYYINNKRMQRIDVLRKFLAYCRQQSKICTVLHLKF